MNQRNELTWQRVVLIGFVAVMAALGMGATAFADVHIVMQTETSMPGMPSVPGMPPVSGMEGMLDDDVQELFMKNNRITTLDSDGTRYVVDCAMGEFAMVADSHQAYWQGTMADFLSEIQALFEMAGMSDPDEGSGWVDEMFGSGRDAHAVPVRTIRVGAETVAGYDAVQYSVEFQQDGAWQLFANVSVAPGLLRQIETEVGPCFNTVFTELQMTLVAMSLGEADEMWSVVTSPEYTALAAEGFPVRTEQTVETFGMRIKTTTEVTNVSSEPLADELFIIPDHYEPITLLEAMMPGS